MPLLIIETGPTPLVDRVLVSVIVLPVSEIPKVPEVVIGELRVVVPLEALCVNDAAFIVGYMSEKRIRATFSFGVGTLVVYACGAAYLSTLIGFQKAILLGVIPFLVGDLLKTVICLKILTWRQKQYVD